MSLTTLYPDLCELPELTGELAFPDPTAEMPNTEQHREAAKRALFEAEHLQNVFDLEEETWLDDHGGAPDLFGHLPHNLQQER